MTKSPASKEFSTNEHVSKSIVQGWRAPSIISKVLEQLTRPAICARMSELAEPIANIILYFGKSEAPKFQGVYRTQKIHCQIFV